MGKKRRKKRKLTARQRQQGMRKIQKAGVFVLASVFAILVGVKFVVPLFASDEYKENNGEAINAFQPDIDVELLTVNPYSRPGTETNKITGIVVHYTANPGSTAMDNRNYFEGLKDSHETKASSNFVVGLEGEIVQCVPTWEVAYASNSRNIDTVSIECCHPDETGRFNDATYQSMVKLCAWLCMKFDLTSEDVIRHYDVTGKNCPKYFVENEDAFAAFRDDITQAIENTPSE
ncbi:N-acetylmuramoyl-L-alanine amidase [Dorea acetigenes]|uniref:N-acetylmuramoyl-L-alanine amidase n=1 Tax=Dorea acetigenes TaxID=2981787 RepID=A0ABT2RK13_9FIRM|nr:peptidoglycan recognition family protein [Dorea acetigenes]MCU6685752.1 N-acetylmuramoyl-L-alanine amidase [Dorea acetigenes]